MGTLLGFSSSFVLFFFESRFSLLSHNFYFTDFAVRHVMPFGVLFSKHNGTVAQKANPFPLTSMKHSGSSHLS
jgi:hypothetical protein